MAYTYYYELEPALWQSAEDLRGYAGTVQAVVRGYLQEAGCFVREIAVDEHGFSFRVLPDVPGQGRIAAMFRRLREAEGMQGYYAAFAGLEKTPTRFFHGQARRYSAVVRRIQPLPEKSMALELRLVETTSFTPANIADFVDQAMFFFEGGAGGIWAGQRMEAQTQQLEALLQGQFGEDGGNFAYRPEDRARNLAVSRYLACFTARVEEEELATRLWALSREGQAMVDFTGVLRKNKTASGLELYAGPDYAYLEALNDVPQQVLEGFAPPEYGSTLAVRTGSLAPTPNPVSAALAYVTQLGLATAATIPELGRLPRTEHWQYYVYDVCQAQATALKEAEETMPALYFDYGVDIFDGERAAGAARRLLVNENIPIIISHVHSDHWKGLAYNLEAFKTHWYMPRQAYRPEWANAVAQIIAAGGTVECVETVQQAPGAQLAVYPCTGAGVHQTGLCLTVEIGGCKLLVPGDNHYRCIPPDAKDGLQVLVASHHGGAYGGGHTDIPLPASRGRAVYSYGEGNRYGHPSTKYEHERRHWVLAHQTPDKGDYCLPEAKEMDT